MRTADAQRCKGRIATALALMLTLMLAPALAHGQSDGQSQAHGVNTVEGGDRLSFDRTGWPRLTGELGQLRRIACPMPAPAIAFGTADGVGYRLSDFRGRVVVLNFWATWCPPCVAEMPALDRLQAARPQSVAVVTLTREPDALYRVPRFFARHVLMHVTPYMDPGGELSAALQPPALPTTIVIDRNGDMVASLEGAAEWDSAQALALLDHIASGDHRPAPEPLAPGEVAVETRGVCY